VDTSGIVLFSLTEEFQPSFDALVAGTGLRKRYWAVIEGALPWHDDRWHTIDAPIARDRHDARRMRVGRTGKPAVTLVRTVERHGRQSLVEAELATGRRHQIRVHLAHLGHPICGDSLYGGTPNDGGLLLHAHEAQLTHPLSGELLVVRSALPARLGTWGLA
jgi:23S rRNA pseudouridine1911/1915/1917 synthase